MSKYRVRVYETIYHEVELEAESASEASAKAYDEVMNETLGLEIYVESLGTDGNNIYVEELASSE